MLSSLTLNDQAGSAVTLHETTKRSVLSVSGLLGVSAPRRTVRPLPTGHGSIDQTRYTDEALIEIVGDVFAATQELTFAEFRLVMAPMLATLDGNPALLKWTEGAAGLALQRLVKLAGPIQPPLSEGAALLRYQALLAAADPRAYSQTLQTITGSTIAAGGTAVFANAGLRGAPVIIQVFTPSTSGGPKITASAGGLSINVQPPYSGTATKYLEIDTAARTVSVVDTVAGTSVVTNSALVNPVVWADLPAGNTTLTLTNNGTPAPTNSFIKVIGRSAY